MRLAIAAVLAACRTTPATTPRAIEPGVVEGDAIDVATGEGVPGVDVMVDGPCRGDEEIGWTITNERGHFRIELLPGLCNVYASVEGVRFAKESIEIVSRRTTRFDARLDHDKLAQVSEHRELLNCPSSDPRAVVEGHTTSQADLDDVARAVLERFIADEGIPDAVLATPTFVSLDVRGSRVSDPWRRLSAAAFPRTNTVRFLAKTRAQLQADADRTNEPVRFIFFAGLDSDGSCAIVDVEGDTILPTRDKGSVCTCTGKDIYEKREGRWTFVRRVHKSCG